MRWKPFRTDGRDPRQARHALYLLWRGLLATRPALHPRTTRPPGPGRRNSPGGGARPAP